MFLKQIPHPVYHVYLFSHLDPYNEIILGVLHLQDHPWSGLRT